MPAKLNAVVTANANKAGTNFGSKAAAHIARLKRETALTNNPADDTRNGPLRTDGVNRRLAEVLYGHRGSDETLRPSRRYGKLTERCLVRRRSRASARKLSMKRYEDWMLSAHEGNTGWPSAAPQTTCMGTITFWNAEKGFGFIKRDDGRPDLFCHINEVADDVEALSVA